MPKVLARLGSGHNQVVMNLFTDSRITRRHLLTVAGGGVLMSAPMACGWLQDLPVSVAAHVWLGNEPMFMARDRGWLDASQVTLQETRSAIESMSALRAGKVQAAALTLDEVLGARATGLALSVVLVFNVSMGADMLLVRPGITELVQLKGLRIGHEASSVAEIMLAEILKVAGLTRQDVQLQAMPIGEQTDAWRNRVVDAVISYEPMATQLLAQGMIRLFDSRQMPGTVVDVLAVRSDALGHAHAKAIRHLVATHFRAVDEFTRNPQDAAYRMAGHLNLPAAGVLAAFKGLILPTVANNHQMLAGSAPEMLSTTRRVAARLSQSGLLAQKDALTDLVNGDYLPAGPATR